MWDNIRNHIENGDFIRAKALMDEEKTHLKNYDDIFAILDASICEAEADLDGMFHAIAKGLAYNPASYELYYMLGRLYCAMNPNQAFLCFENALLYCNSPEDRQTIQVEMENLKQLYDITVRNTVIVIVSYNSQYLLQKSIESIRNTLLEGTYSIVVVDNASDDGAAEWLETQKDIILIKNKENRGFPCACNQGVRATLGTETASSNIFLLNNDTRLALNSLFWLRMGLYENEKIGAAGGYSNYAGNEQQLDIIFTLPDEYLEYGAKINIPLKMPYEERIRLSGFALLVKRSAWDVAGGMDEQFSPGYFEDDDLCMQISRHGFKLLLCKNSFIYHAGSQSFNHAKNVSDILLEHHQLFSKKYGFDILKYACPDRNLPAGIPYTEQEEFNLLHLGCGLGADLKLLQTLYPHAHMIGIEPDPLLFSVASGTEIVFQTILELTDFFHLPVFDVLIINLEVFAALSESDKTALTNLCRKDCVILPKPDPYAGFPFEQIKLVIWDLDDTFWKGTLSEENVDFLQENIQLVKALTDCGIINSISSKNDAAQVQTVLEELQLSEYFVFNDINWENKGIQIEQKLAHMGLRAENALFIDDNIRNLEEAKYISKGLMTALPDILPYLIKYVCTLEASDMTHKRLASYKVLENKTAVQSQFDSKEAFLFDSNITVTIEKNCLEELDRLVELVARTNQLNFTKIRSSRQELLKMISNDWMDSGYIRVRDKYGDYGIAGFYCLDLQEQRLKHFLFSCRIMGMGVEQYVYGKIGYPNIDILAPVASTLEKGQKIPWISESIEVENTEPARDDRIKILLKGPCDIGAIESYLIGGKITTEFNYVNSKGVITAGQNHSMHIWESANCQESEINDILKQAPFLTHGDFKTLLFQKEYHVICYSLLPDCHAGLYRNKKTGLYASFGSVNFDLTDMENMSGYMDGSIVNHGFSFTEKIIRDFAKQWEFVGTTPGQKLIRNLQYMYDNALGTPTFVLLLGSEIEYEGENTEFAFHAERHKEINALVKAFAEGKERIKLINITDFIKSQEDYEDCINHFSRNVYYNLATAVCAHINEYNKNN
ncbi:MAG: glycosyltransferase [Roseburia sp.]|nr:glycosyltransferase [Roseburia sp.]MCM1278436.1 glycosyltransferase [Robinsoniella sp.]